MKGVHLEGIAQSLSLAEISDGGKGIVHEVERDVLPGQATYRSFETSVQKICTGSIAEVLSEQLHPKECPFTPPRGTGYQPLGKDRASVPPKMVTNLDGESAQNLE